MRQLILRILAMVITVVGLFQLVIGVLPATAATIAPARPATVRSQIVAIHLVANRTPRQLTAAARTDHELVVKSWANIRTAPTTVGNRPVGHFVWHSRFTALHRIVYGQHPYGPGSSNHWLKITSGRSASATQSSTRPIGNTQTGQPGPCTNSTASGSICWMP